jgi:two-component system sensor histidine kinase DegS
MKQKQSVAADKWRLYLNIIRLCMASVCLSLHLVTAPEGGWGRTILWSFYLCYSGVALFWKSLEQAGYVLLGMLVDTVFFLVAASQPGAYSVWITSVFYLYLLLNAALLHSFREVFIVIGATLAFFFLARPTETVILSPILLLVGLAVCAMALQKKGLEDRLSAADRQAKISRAEAEQAREAERERIAADFHDGPLQVFAGMQMRLEVLRKLLDREPAVARDELNQIQELCKAQTSDLRAFVRSMRPADVDGSQLMLAIRKLVEQFEKESGIPSSFVGVNAQVPLDNASSREVLQIVREALHNAQKHSRANRTTVAAALVDGSLEILVEDDGEGFPFSGSYNLTELELLRLGPLSIRRRVRGLSGDIQLASNPGRGASLRIRVPL